MKEYLHSFTKLEFDKVLARLASLAATDLGKSKILSLQPLSSLEDIQSGLKSVTEMRTLIESDTPPSFDGVTDCRQSLQHATIADNVLSAPELRHIANVIAASTQLKGYFHKRTSIAPLLAFLSTGITVDKVLQFNIDGAINDNGEIRDNASKKLQQIRASVVGLREKLRKKLEDILEKVVRNGWAQEEIITTREGRMVIPVKAAHQQQIPGFIHSTSASGATVFIEPAETLDLNNTIRSFLFDEEREIQRILKELTNQVRSKVAELLATLQIIEHFDIINAKARYSIAIRGSEVSVPSETFFSLLDARHPLMIEQHSYNNVVPLNIDLGRDYHTILISGPNAGGKSVALKTLGLISVMVHHGLHVPASPDSSIPLLENIFVDIGDEQSIEHNLSTFTSHLTKLKLISDQANSSSLVLVDEICAGTDPSEGGALAAAILKKLTEQKCHTVATTHNSVLKAFAEETEGMMNASMDFDQVALTPTYKLRLGKLGSSYALEIAQRTALSNDLISHAKEILGYEAQRLSGLITNLEKEHFEIEQQRVRLANEEKHLEILIIEYEAKFSKLKSDAAGIKKDALQEAKQIVDESHSLVERCIQEIREHNGDGGAIRRAKEALRDHASKIQNKLLAYEDDSISRDKDFLVGDFVKLKNGNETGEVLEVPDKNTVVINSGSLKIKVSKSQIVHVNHQIAKTWSRGIAQYTTSPKRSTDVRGLSGNEAIEVVDKTIDSALLSQLGQVEIIHGVGTGALRKKIQEFLANHPQVQSYRTGEWNEGGMGVTIVEIK